MPGDALMSTILAGAVERAKVTHLGAGFQFPLIVRGGVNARQKAIHYLLNYSANPRTLDYPFGAGTELLSGESLSKGNPIGLGPWGVAIIEESTPPAAQTQ
jgi:beta-galactosidase